MSLKRSYSLIAPLYDPLIRPALAAARARSLEQLPRDGAHPEGTSSGALRILVNGIGTGLDIPHLPAGHRYTGLDLTRAMLKRAAACPGGAAVDLVQGDSLALPFRDASFDWAVLHLILAVVPEPERCLKETARVVRPGGAVLVLDKFLRRGQRAWLRRSLSPLAALIATRLDVVFEEVLEAVPQLRLESDQPVLLGGWFRSIRLTRL